MERRISTFTAPCQSKIHLKRLSNKHASDSSQKPDASQQQIGKVVGFLGLKGVLKIGIATNNPSLFLNIKDVTFRLANQQEVVAKVKMIRLNKHVIELTLADHTTRNSVEHLLHAEVLVEQSQITSPSEDEWWVRDLVGMKVFTTDGSFVGTVCDALGKDGQFLEIERADDQKTDTVLVPFVRQLVPVVDINAGRIEIVDLPGLLD
jgi:16S rRNA processing protein RimM